MMSKTTMTDYQKREMGNASICSGLCPVTSIFLESGRGHEERYLLPREPYKTAGDWQEDQRHYRQTVTGLICVVTSVEDSIQLHEDQGTRRGILHPRPQLDHNSKLLPKMGITSL